MVQYYMTFDDTDPEPEPHLSDECDPPIPEEDEEEEGDTGTTDDQLIEGSASKHDP
jgi:hypothetical protein